MVKLTEASLIGDHSDEQDWAKLKGGEWHVENQKLSWDVLNDFRTAAIEGGFPEIKHFNNSNHPGCGYFQVTMLAYIFQLIIYVVLNITIKVNQHSGVRLSAHRAFLKPVKKTNN